MDNVGRDEVILLEEKLKRLTYEQEQLQKELKQIEKSGSWRHSKPLRFWMRMKMKFLPSQMNRAYVKQLERKNIQLQQVVLEQEELLEKLLATSETMTTLERQNYLRNLKNEGKLIHYLQTYIEHKTRIQSNAKEALIYIARLYMNEDSSTKNYVFNHVRSALAIEELPDFIVREGIQANATPLLDVASFRVNVTMRLQQYHYNKHLPEWVLDDKRLAYSFVDQFGMATPVVSEQVYTIDTLPKHDGIAVKPVDGAGGRGVYIIHDENDIIDIKRQSSIKGWEQLYEYMRADLQSNTVNRDEWMIENIIYENRREKQAGRDFKFYCFYGKVGLILEIIRYPEVRHCWWTRDMERIAVGKYDESLFTGKGVTDEEIQSVEALSKAIPAPFVRIDFLQGEEGLVFGEFTPKPGNYDEFDLNTDRQLGGFYIEAESKLNQDLLMKKSFEQFEQLQSLPTEV